MTSRTVTVVNPLGMHARAAAKFVHVATRFQAHIRVARDTRQMDGKSIMGILLLAASCGSILTITATGSDEADAVEALAALVLSGFGEDATGSGLDDENDGTSNPGPGSAGQDR
jgi:phosphotransferase system HPr (HPr) family protein